MTISNDPDRAFREDMISRLARIEEGVAGLYPRMDHLEARTNSLETWRTRLVAGVGAVTVYLSRGHLEPLVAFFS